MSNQLTAVARVRSANTAALCQARFGTFPDPGLLIEAQSLDDQSLVTECQISRAAAMATAGYPEESGQVLSQVETTIESGLQLEAEWSWRYFNTKGLIADDFAQVDLAWQSHITALELAEQQSLPSLAGISLSNLALISLQTGIVDEAMARLVSVVSNPDLPPDALAATHLLLSLLFSRHNNQDLAIKHRRLAEEFALRSTPSGYRRSLVAITNSAIGVGETDEALAYFERIKELSEYSWSPLGFHEYSILQAKLLHLSNHHSAAISAISQAIEGCSNGLTIQKEAIITLAEFFLADQEYCLALQTLAHPELRRTPRAQEFRILSIRRSAHKGLKQWELAADCFEDLARLSKAQTPDVLTLYGLQCASNELDLIRQQNQDLHDKNRELEALWLDKEAIMNMIANNLQSPLTALQLTIELLNQQPTPSNIERRVFGARRIVSRIKTVARHLSLAGELEAETIIATSSAVWLPELFSRIERTAGPALLDRSIALHCSVSDPVRGIRTDPERLQQLLEAVLWGVSKFSPPNTAVTISALPMVQPTAGQSSKQFACIRIAANDLGVSLDALEQLRHKRAWSGSEGPGPDASSDLSFYLADRLATAIGTELAFSPAGASGTSFDIALPVFEQ